MLRAPVPKTAINEDCYAPPSEGNIDGSSWTIWNPDLNAVAQALSVQSTTKRELVPRRRLPETRHTRGMRW